MITQSAIFNKTGMTGMTGMTAFLPNFPKVILTLSREGVLLFLPSYPS